MVKRVSDTAARPVGCDLHITQGKHHGLYQFRRPGDPSRFIYACAACMGVLVFREWDRKAGV